MAICMVIGQGFEGSLRIERDNLDILGSKSSGGILLGAFDRRRVVDGFVSHVPSKKYTKMKEILTFIRGQ